MDLIESMFDNMADAKTRFRKLYSMDKNAKVASGTQICIFLKNGSIIFCKIKSYDNECMESRTKRIQIQTLFFISYQFLGS